MKQTTAFLFFLMIISNSAWGWGERGHHIVGQMAARSAVIEADSVELRANLGTFFSDRAIQMGHMANVPDTSWKDSATEPRISRMNSPNHYFGPERVLGAPEDLAGPGFERFLSRIKELPADYAVLKERYDGTPNLLPGVPENQRSLKLYEQLGVTPWRAEQLYDLLVEAFRCAKSKENIALDRIPYAYAPVESPFREPADRLGETSEPPLPSYVCREGLSRRSDLYAAVVIAGTLAHFIGDQSQPYHPTADHDGWVTGNGGIHSYYEDNVVQNIDERLSVDVLQLASDPQFRASVWRAVGTNINERHAVAKVLLLMAVDAQRHKEETRIIDDQVAIIEKSAALAWGDHPRYHPEGTIKRAIRKPSTDPRVLAAFRPLVVERLATSVVVLSKLWMGAWKRVGSPILSEVNQVTLPYPLDPPFIWPDFDSDALERSRGKELDSKYPTHWWAPVSREGAPDWEILPQDAAPGEVILSKRNELGILSNFTATPFEYGGKRYASIEGFWQMMKYPENAEDPRAQHPGLEWKYTREQVSQMTAFEAKEAGSLASTNMRTMGIDWVSFEGERFKYRSAERGRHYTLIVEAMRAKMTQNEQVRAILLATGDLILKPDHKQEVDAPPEWRYYEIWMQFRS